MPRTAPADDELDPDFEALLGFLRDDRGVDFTGYKRASLRRLVARRMSSAGVTSTAAYLDQLQVDPAEVRALFDSLLINVTSFFRDPTTWESLRTTFLPPLLTAVGQDQPVRVWSAACATGEEAYTLAVLLHEALGDEAFRRRVKVYATDVDEPALTAARAGRFSRKSLEGLSDEQVEAYFPRDGDSHVFRQDLRQNLIFGRHDLLSDAPISRVSLLVCRNVLMYFTAETQTRILERFSFALHEGGLLLLGKAEMLLTHSDLFTPVDLPHRIFRGAPRRGRPRLPSFAANEARAAATRSVTEAAFLNSPDAQVVLDADLHVALVNESAGRDLGISRQDVGRLFAETELSFRPVELRGLISTALEEDRAVELQDVRWPRRGERDRFWDVQVAPLRGESSALGVRISFAEVTRYHDLTGALTQAHAELQEAYEELQSSSEELETTNEELQSAIEELETTNEELQSTNEELETMNEELQSTNEELQTVNDELRERTGEVGEVNAFLESVLSGLRTAVAVVDTDLKVMVWNARAERLWGLRAFEVEGERLALLPGSVPVEPLLACVRSVLRNGGDPVPEQSASTTVATNRFGQQVLVTLAGSPLLDRAGAVRGAILTMDEHSMEQQSGSGDDEQTA
ncbi:MAG: chemotaxis protein CheR [Frankiales bacterium]|nr:chemotaxis protein CheR [Frankiales bacterium]